MIRGFCGSIADLIVPPQGDDPHPTDFDRSADDCGSIRSVRSPSGHESLAKLFTSFALPLFSLIEKVLAAV